MSAEPMSDERRQEIEHWARGNRSAVFGSHSAGSFVRDLLAEVDRLRSDLDAARNTIHAATLQPPDRFTMSPSAIEPGHLYPAEHQEGTQP